VASSIHFTRDRLVKHPRLAKVKTMQDANRFLEEEYWPEWNERFARPLEGVVDMHRPLTAQTDLASALSHVEQRVVSNDYTFSFAGRRYQIVRTDVKTGMRGKSLRIELHLNGALRARFEGVYADVTECGAKAPAAAFTWTKVGISCIAGERDQNNASSAGSRRRRWTTAVRGGASGFQAPSA
jgi:hypothetical protein